MLLLDLMIEKFIIIFQIFNAGFPIEIGRVHQDVRRRNLFEDFLF